jgi:hypothetical protein
MKRTLISAAVASAFILSSGSAFALVPGDGVAAGTFNPASTPQVYISGASAQNGGIESVIRRLCTAGSLDSYAIGSTQRVFVCTDAGSLGTGGPIAIHKETSGGSSNGINPVKAATTTAGIVFIDLPSIATGCTTSASVASVAPIAPDTLGLPAYTKWSCASASATAQIPHIGFTDVDPPLFGLDGTGLSLYSPNQLIFGLPVTKALRNALQTAQGLTSGDDTPGQTPSLTSGQVAALFNGTITTPAALGVANASAVGATSGVDSASIYVARRGSGSGTQATAEAVWLNARITNTASTTTNFVAPPNATYGLSSGGTAATTALCGDGTVGPTWPVVLGVAKNPVVGASNSDNVVNCLNRHNAGNRYAVGVLSMEYNQDANPTNTTVDTNFATGFRYIRIDGALPTIGNVIRGSYNYFSEQVVTAKTGMAGVPETVRAAIVAQLGDPNVLSSINNGYTQFTGTGATAGETLSGLLRPGTTGGCAAHTTFATMPVGNNTPDLDPVNFVTKNPTGTKVNNAIKPAIAVCKPRF